MNQTTLDRYLELETRKANLERLLEDVELEMDAVYRELSEVEVAWLQRRDEE